jgi:hypothetical protein
MPAPAVYHERAHHYIGLCPLLSPELSYDWIDQMAPKTIAAFLAFLEYCAGELGSLGSRLDKSALLELQSRYLSTREYPQKRLLATP